MNETTIKFEGLPGCGKTTLLNFIRNFLETKEYLVLHTGEHTIKVSRGGK